MTTSTNVLSLHNTAVEESLKQMTAKVTELTSKVDEMPPPALQVSKLLSSQGPDLVAKKIVELERKLETLEGLGTWQ